MFSVQGPTYTFNNASAYRYARAVARELMRCRETQTRYWALEVYREGEGPLFDILFATIDPTLDHLRHELRLLVEKVSGKKRGLKDAMYAARLTLRESQSLVARSHGRPHLICENGEVTIRGFGQMQGAS
jgi:hypothetical protein